MRTMAACFRMIRRTIQWTTIPDTTPVCVREEEAHLGHRPSPKDFWRAYENKNTARIRTMEHRASRQTTARQPDAPFPLWTKRKGPSKNASRERPYGHRNKRFATETYVARSRFSGCAKASYDALISLHERYEGHIKRNPHTNTWERVLLGTEMPQAAGRSCCARIDWGGGL